MSKALTVNVRLTRIGSLLGLTALLLVLISPASAQTFTSVTDGSTPSALTPGAPAGSYALSSFENVNLYNGNLNFALPLVHVGGRGGAEYTMLLTIEQHWRVRKPKPALNCELTGTCDLRFPWPTWWGAMNPDYGTGVLQGRKPGVQCGDLSLTRLTFTGPGGTEFELRDQTTNGQPLGFSCGAPQGASRGTVFVTSDGSAVTFVSDTTIFDTTSQNSTTFTPSGYLMLRDGTRYRIDAGKVTWMRDRNGNKLTFTYIGSKVSSITDSLNRQVNIAYSVADVAPYGTCDQITFKGFGGAQRMIRVSKTSLANALRTTQSGDSTTTWTFKQLFPELDGSATSHHNPTVVSSLWLPDGQRRYRFYYNVYSELARVELPTGGAIEYDFANATNPYDGIYRRVTERRVYPNGTSLESKTTYSDGLFGAPVTVDVRNASGTLLARSKHYFYGSPFNSLDQLPTEYSEWKEGREYRTETFSTNGATVLGETTTTWQQRAAVSWWTGNPDLAPPNDPRISEVTSKLTDTNQVSKQTFGYDDAVPFNNQNNFKEYSFGTGMPGALLRETRTTYLTSSSYTGASVHIRDLPTQLSIFDGLGTERARRTYEYDNYGLDGSDCLHSFHCPLEARPNISGFDPLFVSSYTTRGNLTGLTRYLLSNGVVTTSISDYSHYDVAGNVIRTFDPRSTSQDFLVTTIEYDDRFGSPDTEARSNSQPTELTGFTSFAFPTKVTNALGQTTYTQFDYYLARPVNTEDRNGIIAAGYFNDLLDRPTQVRRAIGTLVTNQSTFSYDDVNRRITTTSDLNNNDDNLLVTKMVYDGLGRSIEFRQYEGSSNYIATQQQYDALGRVFKTSNPFRPSQGESPTWTTAAFDGSGRVTSVTTPDNAVVTTIYSGNQVTVTDQAGKKKKTETDALGRLIHVWEDPNGANYQTSYQYDVLDNLTVVTQGVQTRTYVYDSLSRLTSAANPESGTVSYGYDNNGNPTSRFDARNITTTFTYDALNRLTSKNYNDNPQTPTVSYFYDSQSLPSGAPSYDRGFSIGRLVAVTSGAGSSEGTYYGYDQLGRALRKYQRTDSVNYLVEASYFANGSIQNETYPAVPGAGDRRVVSHTNDAAGRLAALNSSATSYAPGATVSAIGYSPHNGLTTQSFGNGLIHKITYNNRLQANEIKLGTSGAPTSLLSIGYNYGTTNNNGNVQTATYNGGGLSYTQSFGYDALNRLITSVENSGANWSQTNGYDRYGNRWIDLGGGNQSLYFTTSNNRITGWSYDNTGNLLNDSSHTYSYNGENKITKVDGVSAFVYDGEAQRVRKLMGGNLRLVYGIDGQLIAELDAITGNLKKEYIYGANGLVATIEPTAVNSNGTRYIASDHLGSPRVVTNSSAAVVSRHDYMPFGEELGVGTGGRTAGIGYGVADGIRQKFTLKERDSETGLDYFGARYYASMHARFTSPDAPFMDQWEIEPQSWNLYSVVRNNPLRFVDPSGNAAQQPCDRICRDSKKRAAAARKKAEKEGIPIEVINSARKQESTGRSTLFVNLASAPVIGLAACPRGSACYRAVDWFGLPGFSPIGGGGGGAAARGAGGVLTRMFNWLFRRAAARQLIGKVTREAIELAAKDAGPTVQVFTNQSGAIEGGRGLYLAFGEGAEAMAGAARAGGQMYSGQIPKALVETLRTGNLLQEGTLVWKGSNSVGGQFFIDPRAVEFVAPFLKPVP